MTVGYRHNRDRQTLHYICFQGHRCFCWQHRRIPTGPRGGACTPAAGHLPVAAADMVAGLSALRCGNPICRCRSSKGLTYNPFTLAGRWITTADRMIQNKRTGPDEGCDKHEEGRR
jgi:hypothetical protein